MVSGVCTKCDWVNAADNSRCARMMSALGQKQTFAVQKGMSALPPKADMCGALGYVRFGPRADIDPYSIIWPGNSDPTHGRVIHSVDCFPRLRMMSVFIILKLMSPFV